MTDIVGKQARGAGAPARRGSSEAIRKLHGLPKEQRALVDKWLFDKGRTYQQVSDGLPNDVRAGGEQEQRGQGTHERVLSARALWKVRRKREECRTGMKGERKTGTLEENYQECLKRMAGWALEEMKWPVADERDMKTVFRFMRVLIASRRERNEAILLDVARKEFETWAAKECIKYLRTAEAKRPSQAQSPRSEVAKGLGQSQHAEGLRRGEKDPMMVWNFADGEIRRMPLLRQAEQAPQMKGQQTD